EGSQLTLNINGIEESTGSNTLTLGYSGDSVCDAWEDGSSIDCATGGGGGGGGGGSTENNTIITTAKDIIKEKLDKINVNIFLFIIIISILAFVLLYDYLSETSKSKPFFKKTKVKMLKIYKIIGFGKKRKN
ncbi:MAG: hypothetical protein AABY22_36110, partial [Nanoarchaeota archaeon]